MKKKVSLILAIVLSLSIFVQNIHALRVVMAAEPTEQEQELPDYDDSFDDEDDDDEASRAASEAASKEAERQASEEAKRQASEEAERQAKEEAERQAKAARDEYEAEQAKAAQEAQKKAEEDAAAQEVLKRAEEEEKKREQLRNKVADTTSGNGAEEKSNIFALTASVQRIDFGKDVPGAQRGTETVNITNTGSTRVTLKSSESDPNKAFTYNMPEAKTELAPGESVKYNVTMSSVLNPGTYKGVLMVTDINRDPGFQSGVKVELQGTVSDKPAVVENVIVSPGRITLAVGNEVKFAATVKGTGQISQEVKWGIQGQQSSKTMIGSDGTLYISSDESSPEIKVYAVSMADSSKRGSATVSTQRGGYNVNAYADPAYGGAVTGGGAVTQGGSVTLSAIPNKNYYFAGWIQNGRTVSTATNYTISNVQSNLNVAARFERNYVTVDLRRNTDDGGTVAGGGKVTYGDSTTISAKAYSGYVFTGWKENGKIISRDASLKLRDLKEDRKITAIFEKTSHTLTLYASPAEGGTVTGGGTFAINQGTVAKAVPASGYSFVGWEINGQIVNRDATVKIDRLEADYTCTAIFMKTGVSVYEISSGVATTGGSISPAGVRSVAQGADVTYKITPKSGFAILAVAVDGVQVGPVSSYTFSNVQGNHTIAAAFLMTDAGKANVVASGQKVPDKKVEKLTKTESNTATSQSTVKLEDAVSGGSGDEFVEEMAGLESINVPTDEELGIEAAEDEDDVPTPVTQIMGVSRREAREMAAVGNGLPILDASFTAGTFDSAVSNTLEPINKHGIDYANMTPEEIMMASDDDINPSLPNLDVVVDKMLTPDELVAIVDGAVGNIAISVTKQADVDEPTKKVMRNAVGNKPLQYFDITMMKTLNGNTERIESLPEAMEVIIEVPDEIYKKGRKYSVLRVHNGELTVLPDLDDDPKTITFRTDRFSSYAIAEEMASSRELVKWLAAGSIIALGVAITCFCILIMHQAKMRRMKRKARAEQKRRDERYDRY
jgi:hypothetical protein